MDDVTELFEKAALRIGTGGCGEAELLDEIKHGPFVSVVMVVIVKCATTERENGEVDERHEEHDFPGIVFQQTSEILFGGRSLSGIGTNPFSGGYERNHEQDEAKDGPKSHR